MYTCKVANAQANFTCNIKNTYQHKWPFKKPYIYTSSREKNKCFKKQCKEFGRKHRFNF